MTTSTPLLEPAEPPAFELVNARGKGSAVLVCDHASNRVPRRMQQLGLNSQQLADHIGWDPGAADVARALSALLDAPLVLSGYSRLVIDCNRPLQSRESIAEQSAGVPVPGNRYLSAQDRERRIATFFQPYPIDDAFDYTIPVHGEGRGLASAMIEIRQNEIQSPATAAVWAARLAHAVQALEAEALASSPVN